jgi:hypothetical protein
MFNNDVAILIVTWSLLSILARSDNPLGPWAKVGIVVMMLSLYTLLLVPEQFQTLAIGGEVVGSIGILLNRWDGRLVRPSWIGRRGP